MDNQFGAPWLIVDKVEGADIGYRAIIDKDLVTVCMPSPMGEQRANLIAAAPQLYTALKALMDAAERSSFNAVGLMYMREVAGEAIARAEGARWCKSMKRPAAQCGCPDCGPSLIDYAGE